MRCGKCKEDHETVDQVRACYIKGGNTSLVAIDSGEDVPSREALFGAAPEAEAVDPRMAREKQLSFLSDLRVERGMDPLPPGTKMHKSIASAKIAELLALPPAEVKTPATVDYANVPEGHYAVPGRDGRDLDFYRVDRPEKGRWAGRVFLKMVVGGKPDSSVRERSRVAEVLAAIAKDPERAAWLYGVEIGQCNKCNRHLTDKVSRDHGRGPDCRAKYGAGFFGRQTQAVFRAAPADLPKPASRPARRAS